MFSKDKNIIISLAIVFIFLNVLGFPGQYTRVFGAMLGTLIEYTAFLLEMLIMLFTSGESVMDIKLLNFKKKYWPLYFFVAAVIVCSMLATPYKSEELVTCVRVSVTALFAIWMCENMSVEDILELLFDAQLIFVVLAIAFPIFFKQYDVRVEARANTFLGFSRVKNVIASELAFSLVMQSVLIRIRLRNEKPIPGLLLITVLVEMLLLIRSEGTGALLLTIIISGCILLTNRDGEKRLPLGFIFIAGVVGFLIFALTIIPLFEPLFNLLGKDATLTGRIPLWNQIINVMLYHKTLTGFGYGMFWRDPVSVGLVHAGFASDSFMGSMTAGAHNNLLEMWANIGLIGVGAFYLAIYASFDRVRSMAWDEYIFSAGYLFFYMVIGWTERNMTTFGYDLLFIFLAMAMGNHVERERKNVRSYSGGNDLSQKMGDDRASALQHRASDAACFGASADR